MKIEIPTKCPSCDSNLERVNDQLFCRNPNCNEKQIKQVVNFAKVMKIKGLGEKTVEKLGIVSIPEIYSLTLSAAKAAIGEKLAIKLLDEIELAKNTSLDVFIAACSIPLIGQTAGRKLNTIIHDPSLITENICKKAGLGDKATSNLLTWFNGEYMENLKYLPITFGADISNNSREGYILVCITGRVPGYTKASLANYLDPMGVSVVDTVTSKINYLICEDRKNSSKEQKATELGIKIVKLEELIKEII